MTLLVLSVLLALSISALCSLMEAALLSLSPSQVASIAEKRPRVGAIWRRFKSNIERPIAAILILNTTSHTIGASVAGAEFDRLFGREWIWVFSLVFTLLMLQFTEILPKGLGVRYNRLVALWTARPLTLLTRATAPIALLVNGINALFTWHRSPRKTPATMEEITALASLARMSKEITTEHERIIRRGSRLAHIAAREIMRPRVEIDAMDVETPRGEIFGAVAMAGFARLPVYEGDLDHIVGFIYNKDLLRHRHLGWPIDMRKILRPVLLVPESIRLDRLLEMYREKKTQMAVVLNEYGGTEGLVTVEDVLEVLVGAIHDEHREQPSEIERQDESSWLVGGQTHLLDLADAMSQPALRKATTAKVTTVGGLVQATLDRIPAVDDAIAWNNLTLKVVAMDGKRIAQVLVTLSEGTTDGKG